MMQTENRIVIDKVLYRVREAATLTGYSQKHLREGCRRGVIPHIRVGEGENARFLINLPLFIEQINRECSND